MREADRLDEYAPCRDNLAGGVLHRVGHAVAVRILGVAQGMGPAQGVEKPELLDLVNVVQRGQLGRLAHRAGARACGAGGRAAPQHQPRHESPQAQPEARWSGARLRRRPVAF
ncbi:hypothetical protein FQZ97_959310 [compost metagenome]